MLARGAAGLAPDLAGRRVVVSSGGTREELDPVRFIGNWSSGLQGYALARTAAARGAEVTLVAANVGLADPAGVKVVRVDLGRPAAGRRRQPRPAPTPSSWPPPSPTTGRRPASDVKLKKAGGRAGSDHR